MNPTDPPDAEPEPLPEQTDNRPRPEDGPQDLSQDPQTAYVEQDA